MSRLEHSFVRAGIGASLLLAACGKTVALPAESSPERAADASSSRPSSSAAPTPSTALPVCGDADWEEMGRARTTACGARRSDFEERACLVVSRAWRCPADIRVAFEERWGPGSVIVMKPGQGGEWFGIVFARRSGKWTVIGFDGGDIP